MKNLVLLLALATAAGFTPQAVVARDASAVTPVADVTFTLKTQIHEGQLVFVGDAGAIKGQINPELKVREGAVVAITVVNGDGAMHDVAVPGFNAQSDQLVGVGSATTIVFRATKAGTFEYLCTIPGHRAAGMFGKLIVGDVVKAVSTAVDVAKNPSEVGEPVGDRAPKHINYDLETTEVEGQLSDGSTYRYWTFNNTVPSRTFNSGLIWPLMAPASPTKTSWPSWIWVLRVKVTSATGVTADASRASTACGVKPATVASANSSTRFFIRNFLQGWETSLDAKVSDPAFVAP